MKTRLFIIALAVMPWVLQGQAGHVMQGVGSVNMSMGGAATAQPLDISGAIQWNPASISSFDESILRFDLGLFFSSPELSSTFGPLSGVTKDDRGASPLPALAYVWSKEGSKHTFGASAFGVAGFGVTFPENNNYPQDRFGNPNSEFNPNNPVNPINFPQIAGGFGRIESDYILLQIGFTWAYEISDKFSIGVQPNIDYASLEIQPNPLAAPSQTLGYPKSDKASAIGFGGQVGLFYDSGSGFKAGASYKTPQFFSDFDFKNTYLDPNQTSAPDVSFNLDYPAIYSIGLGYSKGDVDLALDYRFIDYENTDGFEASGWQIAQSGPFQGFPTGSVNGFGWQSISVISAGFQYKGIDKLPLRVGYTYSSNPIKDELAFFNTPATAIIKNAFQFGLSYQANDRLSLDAVFHYGTSGGSTSGPLLNPTPAIDFNEDGFPDGPWDATNNPLGVIPGSEVSYDMTTSMFMIGLNYTFQSKQKQTLN